MGNQLRLESPSPPLGDARDSSEVSECRLHATCDLDGDGQYELVPSRRRKRTICRDHAFYPSTFDPSGTIMQTPLPVRYQDPTLGDVIPGGDTELVAITGRLLPLTSTPDQEPLGEPEYPERNDALRVQSI